MNLAQSGRSAAANSALGHLSPLFQSYDSWTFGRPYNAALPRSWENFLSGAFGPLEPIIPVGIDTVPEGSARPEPRRWEYPVGWNMPIGVPGTEGLKLGTFATLRSFADLYSVVRACIQTRKNEILGIEWDIQPTEDARHAMADDQAAQDDFAQRRRIAIDTWKHIDRNYANFHDWFSALLEDVFVTDAVALYLHPPRRPNSGPFNSNVAALDLLDGTTIRPLLDVRGGYPDPPNVAFQQYLWGVPRVDLMNVLLNDDEIPVKQINEYRSDQMLYLKNDPRDFTPYGFGPLERALVPVATGLRRQLWALEYFADGSIPGLFIIPGAEMISNATQIRQLQEALNLLAGDQAFKHKIIVLPPGSKAEMQKPIALADQFDEVLYTQVTMAFDIAPTEIGISPKVAAVQSPAVGKEIAASQDSRNERKALKPMLAWLKSALFDFTLQKLWGQEDMEWTWSGLKQGKNRADEITEWVQLITNGIASIDSAAAALGLPTWGLPETTKPIIITGTGPVPLEQASAPPPAPAAAGGAEQTPPAPEENSKPPETPPTPAHHAAQAAQDVVDKPPPEVKAMQNELEVLRRQLRKGKPISEFKPVHLGESILKAVAAEGGDLDRAVEAGRRRLEAEVSAAARDAHVARIQKAVAAALASLLAKALNGKGNGAGFIDDATLLMTTSYQAAYRIGAERSASDRGGGSTPDFYAAAEARAAKQRDFLANLWSDAIAAAGTAALARVIGHRLQLYGQSVRAAYNAGYGMTAAVNGASEATWHAIGDATTCDECSARDGQTFTAATLPGWPGDGSFGGELCEGGMNCRCWLTWTSPEGTSETGTNTGRAQNLQAVAQGNAVAQAEWQAVTQARAADIAQVEEQSAAAAQRMRERDRFLGVPGTRARANREVQAWYDAHGLKPGESLGTASGEE